jgi:hypothetical protein
VLKPMYKKNWGQEGGGKGARDAIIGNLRRHGRRPLVAPDRATAGWLAVTHWLRAATCADKARRFIFYFLVTLNFLFKALACSKGLGFFWGGWCVYSTPVF